MLSLFSGLIGALIGIASNLGLEWYRRTSDARSVAAMLAAEIDAVLLIVKTRKLEVYYQDSLNRLRAGTDITFSFGGVTEIRDDPILQANIPRLGLLGIELSSLVAEYAILIKAVRYQRLRLTNTKLMLAEKIETVETIFALWPDTAKVARTAADQLRQYASVSIPGHLKRDLRELFRLN